MEINVTVPDNIFNIIVINEERDCVVRFKCDRKVQYISGKVIEFDIRDNNLTIELESKPDTYNDVSVALLKSFERGRLRENNKC